MIIYVILIIFIISGLIIPRDDKSKKIYFKITCLLIICISAFRSKYIGNDTIQYVNFFEKITLSNILNYINSQYFEIGYTVLTGTIKVFSDNYTVFLIVTSFFIYNGIFKFIYRNSKNLMMSLLIFVLLLYFFESMSAIRQYLAISVIFLSFGCIKDKKILKYILCVCFATLLHKSAIICILFYYLYNHNINKSMKIFLLLIISILSLIGSGLLASILTKYNLYASYLDRMGTTHLASILGMVINLLIFIFIYYLNNKDKKNNYYINISYIAFLLSILGINFNILGRLSLYFELFNIVAISNSIENMRDSKSRMVLASVIVFFCLLYMSIIMMYRPDWYEVMPYTTSWD